LAFGGALYVGCVLSYQYGLRNGLATRPDWLNPPPPKVDYDGLHVDRRIVDGWFVRVLSTSRWGNWSGREGLVELWDADGKRIDVLETGPILSAAFADRDEAPPFLQIVEYGFGTGYQGTARSWLCFDRGRVERILSVRECSREFDGYPDGREYTLSVDVQVLDWPNLAREKWPDIQTRTVEELRIFAPSGNYDPVAGKLLSTSVKTTEETYHFDQSSRKYRVLSKRALER
jgi:hypothetical protein